MRGDLRPQILVFTLAAVALLLLPTPAPAAGASSLAAGDDAVPVEATGGECAPVPSSRVATPDLRSLLSGVSESVAPGALDVCDEGCTPGNEQEDCLHQLACFMNGYSCNDAGQAPCSGTCGCSVF